MEPALTRFENIWKDSFPDDTIPNLSCLKQEGLSETEKQKYRDALKIALDYHAMRVEDLQKKQAKEQLILEFIADELDKLPVPRQGSFSSESSSPKQDSSHETENNDKPKPKPRLPPVVPKKPNPSPRDSPLNPPLVVVKRSMSTPHSAQPQSGRRAQFNSVLITPATPDKEVTTYESHSEEVAIRQTPPLPNKSSQSDRSNGDNRFSSFKGSSFKANNQVNHHESVSSAGSLSEFGAEDGSEVSSRPVSEISQGSDVHVRRKVGRDSMKRMQQFNIEDSSSDSEEDSNYQQLWNLSQTKTVANSSQEADTDGNNMDDTSAASIHSTTSQSSLKRKEGSRLVRIDYNMSSDQGPPYASITDESIDNHDNINSDEEDDKPQYVRLMLKAYTVSRLRPKSPSSNSTDSTDTSAGTPSQQNSLADNGNKADEEERNGSERSNPHKLIRSIESVSEDAVIEDSNNNNQMRNWVVRNVLQSEATYLEDLGVLIKYKNSFEAAASSSKPVIQSSEIDVIFGNLEEIYHVHCAFKKELEPIVAEWAPQSMVGHLFKSMSEKLHMYQKYLDNYPKSISMVKKCCQDNPIFAEIVKEIKCPSVTEKQHLEEILHRPITRMQRNSLVLQDLLQATSTSHPDYRILKEALTESQQFLREKVRVQSTGAGTPLHVLVKNQLLVEYVSGKARKLRHVFLFNDLLVCTKCNIAKGIYEVKWFIQLSDLLINDKMDDTPVEWKQKIEKAEKEIKAMKLKVKELKAALRKEIKECRERKVESSESQRVQRLTRKLQDQESNLILAEPRLRLTVSTTSMHKCFLLPSDYERREWQETLTSLKRKTPQTLKTKMTLNEVQSVVDSCKDTVQLNSMGQMVLNQASDDDIVSGQLTVTIHKISGLQEACDAYTAVEVDSFGHFYLKAKTGVLHGNSSPVWNESFEIDLESSTTLRIICYKQNSGGDVLLGKCVLNLSKQWLKQGFHEKELSMNEVTLTISINYRTSEQTIRRQPSKVETGVYGVKLSSTSKKEGQHIPAIVTACIEDIERRGLDEVGIYRVSASTADVLRIKKAFDKSPRVGKQILQDVEINAVTGALKLYFRELPEALVTDELYPALIEAYKLRNEEEKQKKMAELMRLLPEPNYHTMMAVLKHLIKVGENESANKMPFSNLAVVFGPTLLKPADKVQPANPMDLFSTSANDAMCQTGILYYYLKLVSEGVQFR